MHTCKHTWDDAVLSTDGFGHWFWECPDGTMFGVATPEDIAKHNGTQAESNAQSTPLVLADVRANDIVRCTRGYAGVLYEGALFRVQVVITAGFDYHGACSGLIVTPMDPANHPKMYPFVWDANRFTAVTK